jgi:hypothetical protein
LGHGLVNKEPGRRKTTIKNGLHKQAVGFGLYHALLFQAGLILQKFFYIVGEGELFGKFCPSFLFNPSLFDGMAER